MKVHSSSGVRLWADRFNIASSMTAEAFGVLTDADGNAYVFGYAGTLNMLIKYDPSGNRTWTVLRTNSFRADGVAFGFQFGALDGRGNVVVTAPAAGATQLAKYSPAGAEVWTQVYTNHDGGDLALDGADNIYVTGSALIKYAPDGTLLWAQEGIPFDYLKVGVLKAGRSGNVYIGSLVFNTDPNCNLCYHFRTAKYDGSGSLIWTNTILANPYETTDRVSPIALDGDENIFLTVGGNGAGGSDFLTIKYNSNGMVLRTNLYNGTGNGVDKGRSIAIDSEGSTFVTGTSQGLVGNDFATVKYSPSGSEAWARRHDSLTLFGDHQAAFVAIDPQKNVIVVGNSTGVGGGSDYDYSVVKYAPNGTRLWSARFASPGNVADKVTGLAVDRDGNIFITGNTRTLKYDANGYLKLSRPMSGLRIAVDDTGSAYVCGATNTWSVVKLNPDGTTNWLRTDNPFDGISAFSTHLTVDAQRNVYVGGYYIRFCDRLSCYGPVGIVKYDADGSQQWVWVAPTFYTDRVSHMLLSRNGDVFLDRRRSGYNDLFKISGQGQTMWTTFPPSGSAPAAIAPDSDGMLYALLKDRLMLVAFDTNGSIAWQSNYLAASFGASLAVDSSGIYLTGNAPSANGRQDIVTIKCDKDGKQLWMQRFDGFDHSDDIAANMVSTGDGSVYVVGYQGRPTGLNDMLTIKYAELSNIQILPDNSVLLQFFGMPGQGTRFQASTNLVGWQDLGIVQPDLNNIVRLHDTNALFYPHRFYRILVP